MLLALGIVAAVLSRCINLSPIIGFLCLGVGLGVAGLDVASDGLNVPALSELGMVFLLFDLGLHFSLGSIGSRARDVFGFGPVQVLAGTAGLALAASLLGLPSGAAILVGATLSLSSTAVVAGLLAEREQQNCPVGQTATAILIFQDVAAIFLLIIAGALGREQALLPMVLLAVAKSVLAFLLAVLLARIAVRPFFQLIARTRNDEVFTATALLVALAAGWATGAAGLSLTLGAFLGGMIIAGTPYRVLVQAEIRPFRGLLLGFFFISVGLSLDGALLVHAWPAVLGTAVLLLAVKVLTNSAASLVFGWSIPGSIQLGFLLAQGSEFAFVILSLPPVRAVLGQRATSILVASVALSLVATPALAALGRMLAGRLRQLRPSASLELTPVAADSLVLIAGMGRIGRTLADALTSFGIGYAAIERDESRLRDAVADGYNVSFGNLSDPHIWGPAAASSHTLLVLTAPSFDVSQDLAAAASDRLPGVRRVAVVRDATEAELFRGIGSQPVIVADRGPGLNVAAAVLAELQIGADRIARWMDTQRAHAGPVAARPA